MTGSAREEAERLVAALLAKAAQRDLGDLLRSFSGTGSQQHNRSTGWATGTAECCVCPVCRAIAAVREPTPHTAERLATGAGDLATGVAGMLRAFSTIAGVTSPKPQPRPAARPGPTPDQAWSAATDHTPVPQPPVDANADPWGAATRSPAPESPAEPDPVHDEVAANPAEPVPVLPVDENADPWGAATRSPAPRPERHEAVARPAGPAATESASTMSEDAGPAVVRAEPRTEESDVVKPTRGRKTDIGDATPRNRPADPWAAAVADDANRVSRGKTGVAGTGSVDHDVAAHETPAPAEDRGTRAGDDAPGDAV